MFGSSQFDADYIDEIPPDYEVSIRGPFTNPISAASEITVNESSVVLEPAGRAADPQMMHHYAEMVPAPDQSHIIASSMYAQFNPLFYYFLRSFSKCLHINQSD